MGTCRTQCKPGVDVVRTQSELEIYLFYILTTSALHSSNFYIFFVNVVDVVETWPGVTGA